MGIWIFCDWIWSLTSFFLKTGLSAREMEQAGGLFFLCVFGLIVVSLLIWILIRNRNTLISMEKESEILLQEQLLCSQYQQLICEEEQKLSQVIEELGESFSILHDLIEKKEITVAMEMLKEQGEIAEGINLFVNTGNMVVNAAINGCFSRAARHHIKIISMVTGDFVGIEDYDLSCLLTNMLDNAIEGCLQIPSEEERKLFLEITAMGQNYIFKVENTIAEQVIKRNPSLCTTKKEKKCHGYGTGIIEEIAWKYHGHSEFYDRENVFCCRVVLCVEASAPSV